MTTAVQTFQASVVTPADKQALGLAIAEAAAILDRSTAGAVASLAEAADRFQQRRITLVEGERRRRFGRCAEAVAMILRLLSAGSGK